MTRFVHGGTQDTSMVFKFKHCSSFCVYLLSQDLTLLLIDRKAPIDYSLGHKYVLSFYYRSIKEISPDQPICLPEVLLTRMF